MAKTLFHLLLVLFLIPSAKAASFCSNLTKDCDPKNEIEKLQVFQCESSKAAHNCDEFYKENPNVTPRDCKALVQCNSFVKVADYGAACAAGAAESIVDMAKGVTEFVLKDTQMPPEMAEREEFFRTCTSAECKREMLGPYVGLFKKEDIEGHPEDQSLNPNDPANEVYLRGMSAKTLYRKLLPMLRKKFDNQTLNEPFIEPWSGKPVNAGKIKTLEEMIGSVLEKAGVHNTACYSPEALAEMRCYALATLIDPLVAAKGISAIQKVASLTAKASKEAGAAIKSASQESKIADSIKAKLKPDIASPIDPKLTIAKYPNVAKKINNANSYLRTQKFDAPFESLEQITWSKYTGGYINAEKAAGLSKKLETMDPEIKTSIHSVINKMNDKEAFVSYMEKLQADAIADIEKKGIAKELSGLENGQVSENAVLRVLVKRAQERGQGNMSMIVKSSKGKTTVSRKPTDNNEAFREAIGQGSFFDKPFEDERHGMSSHLLQQDYVADVVDTSTKGNPKKFWNYLGSKQGVNYWVPLFDSAKRNSFTSPEFTTNITRKYMNFR